MHTIAAHVGISAAAVSTVLANRHVERRLAPATVERIRQAVRELGYVPNVAARRLRAHDPGVHSMDLGILTSFEAPLFLVSRTLRQVQRATAADDGVRDRVHALHRGDEPPRVRYLLARAPEDLHEGPAGRPVPRRSVLARSY